MLLLLLLSLLLFLKKTKSNIYETSHFFLDFLGFGLNFLIYISGKKLMNFSREFKAWIYLLVKKEETPKYMKAPLLPKKASNQLFCLLCSGLILLNNVRLSSARVIACNACIYRPVVSNLNTNLYGSKSNIVDFEFQIPCTFYSPIITVSVPKSYKLNRLSLLPSSRAGQFEDYETSCLGKTESLLGGHKTERGVVERTGSVESEVYSRGFDKAVDGQLSPCEVDGDAEDELLRVFTSLGFEKWQVVSQNTSKCLDIPEYERKNKEVLKVMGNLANGSYVLRFDLQNPVKEESAGNWSLSITSTKNSLPTVPFCLTQVGQIAVTNTIGPMLGPLTVRNTTFTSYYSASQRGEFSFVIDSLKWQGSGGMAQQGPNVGDLEPVRIRLTFPVCEDQNSCYSINPKSGETFCQIHGHKYECYLERTRPELVLSIGLSEALSDSGLSSVFPLKIGVRSLVIPRRTESSYKLKIEVLVPSVPSSSPGFLNLNETTLEQITRKNQCIGQWIKHLSGDSSGLNPVVYSGSGLVYSPVSVGTYKLPRLREVAVQIRYRVTNSETYPVLLKLGRLSDKVQGSYNVRVKPLVEGYQFVNQKLDQRIAYSSVLLNALIYDKSKLQEDLSIEFDPRSDSILLRNVDPNHPLECILLMEHSSGSSGRSKSRGQQFELQRHEWEVEISSGGSDESQIITKKSVLGEILDPRETEISEVGGPFVFVDSEERYSMVVYFFLMEHQYSKMMTISMSIPKSITEYVNTDLKVQVISPESQRTLPGRPLSARIKVTKHSKDRTLVLTLESSQGFERGWWGLSVHITRPTVGDPTRLTEYVEFNVSSSVSTLGTPYLTSLLFLSVHENHKGPYLSPVANKLQYIKGDDYIFQVVSVQQNHSSFHPFPMLKDQVLGLETNSPSYFVTKLMYMERFKFLYIISEPSLDGLEINLVTREIGNLGSSSCEIILILGDGHHKHSKCDTAIRYSISDKARDKSKQDRPDDGSLDLVRRLISNFLGPKSRHTMSVVTLVVEESQAEAYDSRIYKTKDTSPNERVNYNLIIKKNGEVNAKKLSIDPSPTYYETYYQFRKALISTHYYNLYTVPSSIQVLKVCPPEVPILSHEKMSSQPLILKYKFFSEIISSYNYSVTPNIPGTCIKKGLITSSTRIPKVSGILATSLVMLFLVLII